MRTARDFGVYFGEVVLLVAMELSARSWRLCMGANGRHRQVTLEPGDGAAWRKVVAEAKAKLGLPADAPVLCCHEAGRDGFWIHRWLEQQGAGNVVVDSASIEVNRKARRAKTDRLDARQLLRQLQRWYGGDAEALRVVRVPTPEEEDARMLHRERDTAVKERTRLGARIRGLAAAQGITFGPLLKVQLAGLRTGDGRELPPGLRARLARELERYRELHGTIRSLERDQQVLLQRAGGQGPAALVELLMALKGVGWQSAWLLVHELFAWRRFRNRRELAACVGVAGTPWRSGELVREQGISKSGNARVRSALVELAWCWLRYQPQSGLSRWWQQRFGSGQRSRKVGIVALARKLLIALWRMTQDGTIPEGAVLKTAR